MSARLPSPPRSGAVLPLLLCLALAACAAEPPPVPADLAARLEAARSQGWPDVCRVPPPGGAGLSTAAVRAELERARERAVYEAGVIRWRMGLRALPPEPPRAERPAAPPAVAAAATPPPLVETGVGETVRTETASGSLADFLRWLEGALPAGSAP